MKISPGSERFYPTLLVSIVIRWIFTWNFIHYLGLILIAELKALVRKEIMFKINIYGVKLILLTALAELKALVRKEIMFKINIYGVKLILLTALIFLPFQTNSVNKFMYLHGCVLQDKNLSIWLVFLIVQRCNWKIATCLCIRVGIYLQLTYQGSKPLNYSWDSRSKFGILNLNLFTGQPSSLLE